MKNLKKENGAITAITLVTVLFIVSFLISSYILVANKVKTQKEIINETRDVYESKSSMEEIYNSYFNNGNIIPICTPEQLLMIGSGQKNVNVNGRYYNFDNTENTIYMLMNDIRFKISDYKDKIPSGYWTPIGNNIKLKAKFEGKNHKISVIYADNTIEYSDSNKYADIGNWKLSKDGNTVICGAMKLNIGDYVNYTYDTASAYDLSTAKTGYDSAQSINQTTDLKWRVLGVDANGCLTLISDQVVNTSVGFKGATGYNNGVYILNDICKTLYSNTELGVTARSITIEDIEGGFSDTGITKRNEYTSGGSVRYGETNKTPYSGSKTYPVIYKKEEGSNIDGTPAEEKAIGGSEPYYGEDQLTSKPENKESDTATSNLTCTQTYYYFNSTPEEYCKNEKFYEMIFNTVSSYWLASRYVDCDSLYATFGLCDIGHDNLGGNRLFFSYGVGGYNDCFLRPAVSLNSDIIVTKCEQDATGADTNHMHSLSKM